MLNSYRPRQILASFALTACLAGAAHAASPTLTNILPRGAQRGTEVDLVFKGARLDDTKEVVFYDPDLTATTIEATAPDTVKVHVKIAAGAKVGEHAMRLRTATGVSELRNFFVGRFPVVEELADVQPAAPGGGGRRGGRNRDGVSVPAKAAAVPPQKRPSTFENPQDIDLNVTVAGVVENEQIDFYAVECKKGQRLTAEVEGLRLGSTGGAGGQGAFDPFVTIYDANRKELDKSDDTALLRQDCVASVVVPEDGRYIVAIRESAYGGGPGANYRMHVGTFPRPLAVYPAGGKAGDEVDVRFIGDAKGDIKQKVKVSADLSPDARAEFGLFAEQDGLSAPSANRFRVVDFPNVLEAEPNDDPGHANGSEGSTAAAVPVAFNGIIEKDGDADFFKFKAAKGQVLDINVYGRRVRSPLDSVLIVHDAKGNQIANNDDSGGPDSYLRFNVPADGEFMVSVRDQLNKGGPDFVYRIEITPVEPKLTLAIPNLGLNGQPSQERQAIVVPKGNRYATLIRATRADAGGPFALNVDGLPDGITMAAEPIAAGQDVVPVFFEAKADAAVAGKLCDVGAKPVADPEKKDAPANNVEGKFVQTVELSIGQNNTSYHEVKVNKLEVAVADEVPFTIKLVQPKAPLSQTGSMELKVVAERKGDFKGPINLKTLYDPQGVNAGNVTIAPDKTEAAIPLSAAAGAPARKWKIAVLGQADVNGPAWVSTQPAELEVVPPFVAMKIKRTAVEQGQTTQVEVAIDPKTPFDGPAKVELLGYPNGVTAAEKTITAADKQVVFDVKADEKAPAGTHPALFCRVTVMKDGEPVVMNLGQGGILRIDAPRGQKK